MPLGRQSGFRWPALATRRHFRRYVCTDTTSVRGSEIAGMHEDSTHSGSPGDVRQVSAAQGGGIPVNTGDTGLARPRLRFSSLVGMFSARTSAAPIVFYTHSSGELRPRPGTVPPALPCPRAGGKPLLASGRCRQRLALKPFRPAGSAETRRQDVAREEPGATVHTERDLRQMTFQLTDRSTGSARGRCVDTSFERRRAALSTRSKRTEELCLEKTQHHFYHISGLALQRPRLAFGDHRFQQRNLVLFRGDWGSGFQLATRPSAANLLPHPST